MRIVLSKRPVLLDELKGVDCVIDFKVVVFWILCKILY